jgi:hypothetical protein
MHQIWTKNHVRVPQMVLRVDLRRRPRFSKFYGSKGVTRAQMERQLGADELYAADEALQATVRDVAQGWWASFKPAGG